MGWSYVRRAKGSSNLEFFQKEFDPNKERVEILDAHSDAKVIYLLVTVKALRKVMAAVVVYNWIPKANFNFGYKAMEEDAGPNFYNCPERILNRLTPTDNVYANNWRAKCREQVKKTKAQVRPKIGDIIKLFGEVGFQDGWKAIDPSFIVRCTNPFLAKLQTNDGYRLTKTFKNHYTYQLWRNETCLYDSTK